MFWLHLHVDLVCVFINLIQRFFSGARKPPLQPALKPIIKILAVEDLKSDKFAQGLLCKAKETLKKKSSDLIVKQELLEEKKNDEKRLLGGGVTSERMKRFLSMSVESLPKPQPKKYACEKDIDELKRPVDTLRCEKCGILYERVNYAKHVKVCKGKIFRRPKYGCTFCSFTDFNIKEVQDHIKRVHKTK